MNRSMDLSPRVAALVVGIGYLLILAFNTPALAFVEGAMVHGDPAATAANVAASAPAFRLGIAFWLVVLALDTVIAVALYAFFAPAARQLSLLAASFRLVYVAIAAIGALGLLSVPELAADGDQLGPISMLVGGYEYGFNVAILFFGLHILTLAYLAFRTRLLPRLVGIFLVVAGTGYLIDSFASIVSPDYAANAMLFVVFAAVPGLLAEYSLAIWLLARGGRAEAPVATGVPSASIRVP